MSFDDFPSTITSPAISSRVTFKYGADKWVDPAVVTTFEDQISVQVQSTGSGGFWGELPVTIQAPEADADIIFAFLAAHRLRGIPFFFTHRKRGRLLVRYWNDELPMPRLVAGTPDLVGFELSLRQEGGA